MDRPIVVLSCAMSLDGRIDDDGPRRLVLSGPEDLDRVDAERAASDAVLVGAGTVRADDPRLVIRSPDRRAARVACGQAPDPVKVTVTGGGALERSAAFFTAGDAPRLVYAPASVAACVRDRLAGVAATTVVAVGEPLEVAAVLDDLAGRGIRRLLVEGGSAIQAQFLAAGLVDELQLVVAPLVVGAGPRFADGVGTARRATDGGWLTGRLELVACRPVGDVALLRYRRPGGRTG